MVVEPFGLHELKLLPRQVLNEYIPFVGDWCDVTNKELAPGGKCPNWQDPKTAGARTAAAQNLGRQLCSAESTSFAHSLCDHAQDLLN